MTDIWPEADVRRYIDTVMGNTQGRDKPLQDRIKSAPMLSSVMRRYLGTETRLPSYELVEVVLSAAVDYFKEDQKIVVASELMGFALVDDKSINRWLEKVRPPWLGDKHVQARRESVHFRRYVALMLEGHNMIDPRAARNRQKKRWSHDMEAALRSYLFKCKQEALQAVALRETDLFGVSGHSSVETKPLMAPPDGTLESVGQAAPVPGYVHRFSIETQFNDLVQLGAKLIAFVGQAGMGKTTLVRALTRSHPLIEFESGKPRVPYVQAALRAHDLPISDVTENNAISKLVDLMTSSSGPRILVLDNLQSTGQLREIVPPGTISTVIATCRHIDNYAPAWCHKIRVDVMTPDEASRLVETLLPRLAKGDIDLLVESLGCYPLIIEAACGYMRGSGVSTVDVCRWLQFDPGSVKTGMDEKLEFILERTISVLRERDPVAVDVLACHVIHDGLGNGRIMAAIVRALHGYEYGMGKFGAAVSELQDFCLVGFERDPDFDELIEESYRSLVKKWGAEVAEVVGDSSLKGVRWLRIHPLTRLILAGILTSDIGELAERVAARLMNLPDEFDAENEKSPGGSPLGDVLGNSLLVLTALESLIARLADSGPAVGA